MLLLYIRSGRTGKTRWLCPYLAQVAPTGANGSVCGERVEHAWLSTHATRAQQLVSCSVLDAVLCAVH